MPRKRRPTQLQTDCAIVAESLRKACLRVPALAKESVLVNLSLREARQALHHCGPMPHVRDGISEPLPRAYATARAFLEAMDYRFEERALLAFLSALQTHWPFEDDELWALKPFLQMVLLSAIFEIVGASPTAEKARTASVLPAKAEPTQLPLLLGTLRLLQDIDWESAVDRLSKTERILKRESARAYGRMDRESRDLYRKAISELAFYSERSEREVAQAAVGLARAARQTPDGKGRAKERRSHVGFYLIGEGREKLEEAIGYRPTLSVSFREAILRQPNWFYLGGIALTTLVLILACIHGAIGMGISAAAVLAFFFLLLLPASECSVAVVNQLATAIIPPRRLPRLDFSQGIPASCATMVVVPTLLIRETDVRRTVRDLEIRYLGNRDPNLFFALLTDPPDAVIQFDEKDQLAGLCGSLIEDLNRKYACNGRSVFFLLNRHRLYDESEGVWMGWERKRGKLLDFSSLLLEGLDYFPEKAGDLSALPKIKFVITLDADTQLPFNAARKLIATLAHPLNRAVIDPATNTVVEGYGILQPRVGISVHSAMRSRLAALFSGDTGFDPYTRAVSDVYQDLFGEGTYTGKGIYELETYHRVLLNRFPCNALLSHDMVEGAYLRTGLVSDIEVIDDYPSHFSALNRRDHRWIRGDWQIIWWLGSRVPDYFGKWVRNPLNCVSRWKIVDNLRRSLTDLGTLLLLVCGWLQPPEQAIYWTLLALGFLFFPVCLRAILSLARSGQAGYRAAFWHAFLSDFAGANARLCIRLALLCHQSVATLDAVCRALVRTNVTRRKLLEWETAAESETTSRKRSPLDAYLKHAPLLPLGIAFLVLCFQPASLAIAAPFLIAWSSVKPICDWLDGAEGKPNGHASPQESSLIREAALRTWRYFHEFNSPEQNWLIPDRVQEHPFLVANRTSPTNLGLLLNTRLAAYDLGFISLSEFVTLTERTLETMLRMKKYRGHFYNWYDTRSLEALPPYFISSVDSGNLVCCLWALKQGCSEAAKRPLFPKAVWQALRDHADLLSELVGTAPGSGALRDLLGKVQRLIDRSQQAGPGSVALGVLEATVAALERTLSERDASQEVLWWARELLARVRGLQDTVREYAPWLLPQFAGLASRQLQQRKEIGTLTLETAGVAQSEIEKPLRQLAAPATEEEARSAIDSFRGALARAGEARRNLLHKLDALAAEADNLATAMEFGFLYNPRKKLLSIGYDTPSNCLQLCHYDLLASEARAAVFVAIAKGEIPEESWLQLGRSHVEHDGVPVLQSWSGSMFEYLLPNLWMKLYTGTLLNHSTRAAVSSHQKLWPEKGIPWGISESCYSNREPDGQYSYRSFGLSRLALDPSRSPDIVISPYATFLSLMVDLNGAVENLEHMKRLGWLGAYGYYEAADFAGGRLSSGCNYEIVHCWMAHHQGITLASAANVLCDASIQHRFHCEPAVVAAERLLQEKMPLSPVTPQPIRSEPNVLKAFLGGRHRAEPSAAKPALPAIARTALQLVSDGFSPPKTQNDNPMVPTMPPATESEKAGDV